MDVEYMKFVRGNFKYADLDDLEAAAVEIRFEDTDLSLVLILPNTSRGLFELETTMKNIDLTTIINRMRTQRIFAKIPIFQIVYQMSLKEISNQVSVNVMQTNCHPIR